MSGTECGEGEQWSIGQDLWTTPWQHSMEVTRRMFGETAAANTEHRSRYRDTWPDKGWVLTVDIFPVPRIQSSVD